MQDNFMKYIEYLFVTGQLDEMDNEQISEIANELFNDDESLENIFLEITENEENN